MNYHYQNKNERITECGRNRIHGSEERSDEKYEKNCTYYYFMDGVSSHGLQLSYTGTVYDCRPVGSGFRIIGGEHYDFCFSFDFR